jgi:hypothetical protein
MCPPSCRISLYGANRESFPSSRWHEHTVRAGSAWHRKPLVLGGTSGHTRRRRIAGHTPFTASTSAGNAIRANPSQHNRYKGGRTHLPQGDGKDSCSIEAAQTPYPELGQTSSIRHTLRLCQVEVIAKIRQSCQYPGSNRFSDVRPPAPHSGSDFAEEGNVHR